MALVIDTKDMRPADRAEIIRDAIWSTVVRVEIDHHPDPAKRMARATITDLGKISLCSARSNATTIHRTRTLVRDDAEPRIFLSLQVSGTSMIIQGGREAVLRPGDFALFDTTAPYTLVNDQGIHAHYFRIPRSELALPTDVISRVTASRLGEGHAMAELASTYFQRLAGSHALQSLPNADLVGQPSIELIRAVVATHLDEPRLAKEPLQATLEFRIMEYVRAHLAEHDLTAARIAAAHNISVRHLYGILARSGITLGEWVRVRRLEECRNELAKPGAEHMTIASIAQRWGFANPTHFSRAFREAYGMSPRDWRELKKGGDPAIDLTRLGWE
jgi:AraC-like DNA-binding protein